MVSKAPLIVPVLVALLALSPVRAQALRSAPEGLEPLIRRFQTDEDGLNQFYSAAFSPVVQKRFGAFRSQK